MRHLAERRAVVTGAAAGIGRAISLKLAGAGCRLFIIDRNEEALTRIAEEARRLNVEVRCHVADLSDAAETAAAASAAEAAWDGVDILVNNAGIAFYGPTHEMRLDQWERLMAVNLMAPIRLIHALLPSLRKQPQAHILNVSSITGLIPKRRIAAYQASKFGLVGLGQSLRAEYSPYGIGVTTLCCGFVATDLLATAAEQGMAARSRKPGKWHMVSPEYVAGVAVRAIRWNRGMVVVPLIAHLFWWIHRLAPWFFDLQGHYIHGMKRWRQNRKAKKAERHAGKKELAPTTVSPSPPYSGERAG
jgi:short-subunit dehydrogenase